MGRFLNGVLIGIGIGLRGSTPLRLLVCDRGRVIWRRSANSSSNAATGVDSRLSRPHGLRGRPLRA